MWGRRLFYLAAVVSCLGFYVAHGSWVACLVVWIVLGLPWLSLLVSLPAMVSFRMQVEAPRAIPLGTPAEAWLMGSSRYPLPPFSGKIQLISCVTGEKVRYRPSRGLPVQVCGGIKIAVLRPRVCDHLGLFSFPTKVSPGHNVVIRPVPVPVRDLPDLQRYLARSWRPKPGGGFAENHELRLYRPGDNLNQVHWKLSAKTGKLTLREPMEPQRGLVLLTMNHRGTPEERNRKFRRLLWVGSYLLEQQVSFEIRALTAIGIRSFDVRSQQDLTRALDTLLCDPEAVEGSIRDRFYSASWHYHIGGNADEA